MFVHILFALFFEVRLIDEWTCCTDVPDETRDETLARWSQIDDTLDPSGFDVSVLDSLDPELLDMVSEIQRVQKLDDESGY